MQEALPDCGGCSTLSWPGQSDQLVINSPEGLAAYGLLTHNMTMLTSGPQDAWPACSANGQHLAYQGPMQEVVALPTVQCMPGPQAALSARYLNGYRAWHPLWSPNGQWLAFISDVDGSPSVYLTRFANLDGYLNPDQRDIAYKISGSNCGDPAWASQQNGNPIIIFSCVRGNGSQIDAVPAVPIPSWEAQLASGEMMRDNLCWLPQAS